MRVEPETVDRTVVIVDDEESIREGCRQALTEAGLRVGTASCGDEGLRLVNEMRPQVVLVDLKMPGTSGIEVIRRIRGIDPCIVPVVITGYGTIGSAVEAMKCGAHEYICKPFDESTVTETVNSALSIFEHRRSEALLEREKQTAMDNFAAVVCHQLKSPVAAASQWIELLKLGQAGPMTPSQKDVLARAHDRLGDLVQVIGDWLQLSRVESGFQDLSTDEVDLEQLIRDVWAEVAEEGAEGRIDLECMVRGRVHQVRGNAHLLGQVFGNLMRNSAKFTSGPGKITVSIRDDNGTVEVVLRDTGMGIPAEELPHIFDRFYRGARDAAKRKEGSGLGLAIAKAIVNMHGGTIAAASEPDRGATFTIRIPLAEVTKEERAKGN